MHTMTWEGGLGTRPAANMTGPAYFHGNTAVQAEPTVFVVDEDAATCNAIRALSAMMNLRCEVFESGQAFLEHFDRSQCGCLVTELKVRGVVGGLQLQQRLLADGVTLPVIFLSAHGTLPIAVRAMRSGAYHFIEKPIHEQELWDAIQGAVAMDQENRETARQETALRERLAELTLKEEQVLRMIADGKGNRVIARELDVSMRTVEIRRNVLMKKLGLKSSEELLRFALVACNGHSGKRDVAQLVPPRATSRAGES